MRCLLRLNATLALCAMAALCCAHDLQIDNSIDLKWKVSYPDKTVTFFVPASFREDPGFRYQLEGVDDDWRSVTDSSISYAGLPPGDYIFRIADSKGIQSKLSFSVHDSLSGAWLLTAIALALLGGFVVVSFWRRRGNVRDDEESASALKQKLAEMEMKALRAQMNPHFIFNSLNSINRYIVKSDPDTASMYLTKFAKLMRLILENSNYKVIPLEQELSALKLYLELEVFRLNKKFTFTITVDKGVDTKMTGIPPMIIQPFIENAIWHGLLHKDSPGELSVTIEPSGGGIRCSIVDNGVGRKRSRELKSGSISPDKSFGMQITAERLNLIRANRKISVLEITDLKNPEGDDAGTKVVLEIAHAVLEDY